MSPRLASFKALIYAHCGLVLEGVAEDRLYKILQHNAKRSGCIDLNAYERLIRTDAEQFDILVCQLTVNETYFFRELEQLELLTTVLIPQVLAQKSAGQPVRILSAGCSSGEEPYSLVMLLERIYGERTAELFQIDAGDLDQNVLSKARAGVYSQFSFRGVDPAVRLRYFQPQKQGYKLAEHIRSQVSFYQLNLLAPQFPAELSDYDIIFFRNVSIYFDLEARALIQRRFYELMNAQSILFLGSSETLGNDLGVFELVEHTGQYFFIKGEAYRPKHSNTGTGLTLTETGQSTNDLVLQLDQQALSAVSADDTADSVAPQPPTESSQRTDSVDDRRLVALERIQQLVSAGELRRAMRLLESFPVPVTEDYAACLLKSWLLLNQQAFDEAASLLGYALVAQPWSVDAMLMQGLLCKWQQKTEDACQWFRKVIYICPECWPAHYYLADTRRAEEQFEAAVRSYQAVFRILATAAEVNHGLTWIPAPLAASDAVFLSRRQIQQLTADLHTAQVDD